MLPQQQWVTSNFVLIVWKNKRHHLCSILAWHHAYLKLNHTAEDQLRSKCSWRGILARQIASTCPVWCQTSHQALALKYCRALHELRFEARPPYQSLDKPTRLIKTSKSSWFLLLLAPLCHWLGLHETWYATQDFFSFFCFLLFLKSCFFWSINCETASKWYGVLAKSLVSGPGATMVEMTTCGPTYRC